MNRSIPVTYFLHAKCGSNIYLDVSSLFKIVTSFGIGKTVLRIKAGQIIQGKEVDKAVFYCSNCDESFSDLSAILATCLECGRNFSVGDMVSPSVSNGTYCKEHGTKERFPNEILRSLGDLCKKMSVK